MRLPGILFLLFIFRGTLFSQQSLLIYPTHWWAGMRHDQVTLLLRSTADPIASGQMTASVDKPGIKVLQIKGMQDPHYIQLRISVEPDAKPGVYTFQFATKDDPNKKYFTYELKARSNGNGISRIRGVNSKDLTYLILADRFANGDPSNDAFPEMRDPQSDRTNKYARHGGDLKGIRDRLDYFNELGVTTLWFTPLTENDMPKMREVSYDIAGYHGYWFTDHYKIDKRFGGNQAYREFVEAAHENGLKVIQDAIYNHIGLYHWINQAPPDKDWINQWPTFTGPNHREETLMDPYASAYDKNNMVKGWFVPHLPDLNLSNPDVAVYLIQHAIWSVEEFGFDGFRIDTYKYCDEAFLNDMNVALLKEFPTLTTFVEAWSNTVVANAYYVQNNFNIPFKHNAPGAIDFSLCFAMHAAMNQPSGWTEGVNRIYMTLAQDFVYKNPLNNCIFLDNHDMDRVYSTIGENWEKMKWGLNWLLTLRGIPQLYYGTELLMKNFKNPTDAEVRLDFPGGWKEDAVNKFTAAGRTTQENAAFQYIRKLANFRKGSSALTTGKTMQFVVRDGVYVYFRYDDVQTVMVVTNTGTKPFKPDWTMYEERAKGFSSSVNVLTGEEKVLDGLTVPAGDSWVLELKR